MTKRTRMLYLYVADIIAINFALLFTIFIHFEGNVPLELINGYKAIFPFFVITKILINHYFSLYESIWEFASIEELIKIVFSVLAGNAVGYMYMIFMDYRLYFGIYVASIVFEIALVGGVRFNYRLMRRLKNRRSLTRQESFKNVLVVGSGATASMISNEIKMRPEQYGQLIGYIDDDPRKLGKVIAGIKVLGNRHDIYSVVKRKKVDEIILAIPTAKKEDMKEILDECKRTGSKVRTVPGIMEIMDGKVSMSNVRDVEIEDLLGRDPVDLNMNEIAAYVSDKRVLVTGGGGSIGSELCRQIAKFNPAELIILDIYENNAYEIQNELRKEYESDLNLNVQIASVRDKKHIEKLFEKIKPEVVFHAAAHKHVPLMEDAPQEAIKNNVFGTINCAEAAHKVGAERFVLISTDKAVNPTNVMGASKRMCEMVVQGMNRRSSTTFAAVRFGNVLGSNGSVIPLFKKQIEAGGPVTVTHKDIIRYFMTIPEAAQLVIQAGAIADGGEVFVLDMGEPVKIYDLAKDLIGLSGLKLGEDIDIEITGLRPGEKLYEELLMNEEGLTGTKYKKIFIGQPGHFDYKMLRKSFEQLLNVAESGNHDMLRDQIAHVVPTYVKEKERVNKVFEKNDNTFEEAAMLVTN